MYKIKSPFALPVIFCVVIFGFSNCGQQTSNKNIHTDSTKVITAEDPVIAPGTVSSSSVKPGIGDSAQQTQALATAEKEKGKELLPNKTTGKPATPDKESVEKSTAIIPVNQPSAPTKEVAEVTKSAETIKPTPQAEPKQAETPRSADIPTPVATPNEWIVPVKYKTMANPYPVSSESVSNGKSLYSIHCKSCHGSKGDGNGTKAAQIETKINSFLGSDFLSQKEGAIFYKVSTGRKDMPGFTKKIPDAEDRWAVVHYIMNL